MWYVRDPESNVTWLIFIWGNFHPSFKLEMLSLWTIQWAIGATYIVTQLPPLRGFFHSVLLKVDGFHEVLLRNAVPWGSSTQIMVSMSALHTMDRLQTIQTQRVKTYEHLWLSWIHQTYSNMLQTIGSKPKGPQIICLMGFSWFTGNSNAFTSSFITNGKQRETTSKIPWFLSYSFCQQWINEWKDARPDHIIPLGSLTSTTDPH